MILMFMPVCPVKKVQGRKLTLKYTTAVAWKVKRMMGLKRV